MRHVFAILWIALGVLGPTVAQADARLDVRGHGDRERAAHADSLRAHRNWDLWGHAGVGWLGAPAEVRTHYGAGLDAGLVLEDRVGGRLSLGARFAHHDLPSNQPTFLVASGSPFGTTLNSGHGWADTGVGSVAVRTWRGIWLEGAAGGGYFHDGAPGGPGSIDPRTGASRGLVDHTGWGPAWGVGLRYDVAVGRREPMRVEFQCLTLERRSTTLGLFTLGVGFRLF